MSKIKYVFVILIGMIIILEFFSFPSLSDQIRHDKFIYPQMIEDKKTDILESIKINDNVFVGYWMDNVGTSYEFKRDGTGTISGYNMWVETTMDFPFIYKHTDKTITITGIDIYGDLIESKYNYKLRGNMLEFEMDNHEPWYLIRQ